MKPKANANLYKLLLAEMKCSASLLFGPERRWRIICKTDFF